MNREEVYKLINEFHAHLDECGQCRNHCFNLCAIGAALLKKAGEAGAELEGLESRVLF